MKLLCSLFGGMSFIVVFALCLVGILAVCINLAELVGQLFGHMAAGITFIGSFAAFGASIAIIAYIIYKSLDDVP